MTNESGADKRDARFLRTRGRPSFNGSGEAISVVDLFSGCGGMTLGIAHVAHKRGMALRVPLAMDVDPDAISVYRDNFDGANAVVRDVRERFDGDLKQPLTTRERKARRELRGGVDFLVGGPPCQGNSNLNNLTRWNDPRNALYARMARATRVLQPRFVVAENVPSILNDRGGVVSETIDALRHARYNVADMVLDLSRVGVPQVRRRHVLLASRAGEKADPEAVLRELAGARLTSRSVLWAIGDLRRVKPDRQFDIASVSSEENRQRIAWLFDNRSYDLPNRYRPACHRNKNHKYKSVYGRMSWSEPAQTVTTGFGSMGQGRFVHPSRRRTITPHEAARLQGFPDYFSFEAAEKRNAWSRLIGNAVPPFLTMRLAELLMFNS